jgi:hypothetical protein
MDLMDIDGKGRISQYIGAGGFLKRARLACHSERSEESLVGQRADTSLRSE